MARRIMVIKIPLASSGMELVTVQLVAQCLNQMLHHMPPHSMIGLNKTPPAPIQKIVFGYWSRQKVGRYYSDGPDRKSYS